MTVATEAEKNAFLKSFRDPIKQSELFVSTTGYETREDELIYKKRGWHDKGFVDVHELDIPIVITPSATLNGEYTPVGSESYTGKRIEPLYNKLVMNISAEEFDKYATYREDGIKRFINDKKKVITDHLQMFVHNQRNEALTGEIVQSVKGLDGKFSAVTLSFGSAIVSGGQICNIADANVLDLQYYAFLEVKRRERRLVTGKFIQPSHTVILCGTAAFDEFMKRASAQTDNNPWRFDEATGDLFLMGYRHVNAQGDFTRINAKGSTTLKQAVLPKEILMIDTVNTKTDFRWLKISSTNNVNMKNVLFYLQLLENEDNTAWKLQMRAKPLPVIDTKAMLKMTVLNA